MDEPRMRQIVSQARVARLATVDTSGHPHLVPICFALVGDVLYTAVDDKPKRRTRLRRTANLEATGRASVLVDEYSEDWSRLWWVRLDGTGRVVGDRAEAADALDALVAKYPQYRQHRPTGPVLAVQVTKWRGWHAAATN